MIVESLASKDNSVIEVIYEPQELAAVFGGCECFCFEVVDLDQRCSINLGDYPGITAFQAVRCARDCVMAGYLPSYCENSESQTEQPCTIIGD